MTRTYTLKRRAEQQAATRVVLQRDQFAYDLVVVADDREQWMGRAAAQEPHDRLTHVWQRARHVRADATITPTLAATFRDARHPERAPWLNLTRFADEATYDARYSSQQRKRRKKIRKALESEFGPVKFEVLEDGPEARQILKMIRDERIAERVDVEKTQHGKKGAAEEEQREHVLSHLHELVVKPAIVHSDLQHREFGLFQFRELERIRSEPGPKLVSS